MSRIKCICTCLLILIVSARFTYAQGELPDKPEIDYVTIDSVTGYTIIRWEPSNSPGISTYKIYTLDTETFPVSGTLLDSVPASVHSYSYDPGTTNPFTYTVTAVDGAGSESLLSGDSHKPVKLTIAYDSCSGSMIIEWDKYKGWGNTLTGYRIWAKLPEHPHTSKSTLKSHPHDQFILLQSLDTNTLSFVQEDIIENGNYDYVLEAYDNQGVSSTSNRVQYFTYMPPPPSFVNLDYVTVIDESTVDISFTADISGEIDDFRVSRSGMRDGTYTPVATLENLTEPTVRITDNIVTMGDQYFYKVEALNSCRNPILSSNTGNNILAMGEAEGSMISIGWTPYREFGEGVAAYTVYRENQYGEYESVTSLPPSTTVFSENIRNIAGPGLKGEVHYFIEATENGTNPLGISGFSKSNEVIIPVETRIFIPNAFTPNGDDRNEVFIPILDFSPKEYKMFVFDRTGKALFRTTDPTLGWDGTLNGSSAKAREGVYVYHIEYLSYNGIRHVETGNVTLVYP